MGGRIAGDGHQVGRGVLVGKGHTGQADDRVGVGDVEQVAALAGEGTAAHGQGGGALFGVAGHGLIEHDVVDVFIGAGALGAAHIAGYSAVGQGDGVAALDDQSLGVVGGEVSTRDGDICCGINGRGVIAIGGIAAAGNLHRAAAPVGADGSRGVAGGLYIEVGGVGDAAAGGLDAAGVVRRGADGGVRDVDGGAGAVAEHAVAILGAGSDGGTGNGQCRAVGSQQGSVQAVEVAVLGVGRTSAALGDGDALQGHIGTVHPEGVFVVAGGFVAGAVYCSGAVQRVGTGALRHFTGAPETAGPAVSAGGTVRLFRGLAVRCVGRSRYRGICGGGAAGGGRAGAGRHREQQGGCTGEGSDAFGCESHISFSFRVKEVVIFLEKISMAYSLMSAGEDIAKTR